MINIEGLAQKFAYVTHDLSTTNFPFPGIRPKTPYPLYSRFATILLSEKQSPEIIERKITILTRMRVRDQLSYLPLISSCVALIRFSLNGIAIIYHFAILFFSKKGSYEHYPNINDYNISELKRACIEAIPLIGNCLLYRSDRLKIEQLKKEIIDKRTPDDQLDHTEQALEIFLDGKCIYFASYNQWSRVPLINYKAIESRFVFE